MTGQILWNRQAHRGEPDFNSNRPNSQPWSRGENVTIFAFMRDKSGKKENICSFWDEMNRRFDPVNDLQIFLMAHCCFCLTPAFRLAATVQALSIEGIIIRLKRCWPFFRAQALLLSKSFAESSHFPLWSPASIRPFLTVSLCQGNGWRFPCRVHIHRGRVVVPDIAAATLRCPAVVRRNRHWYPVHLQGQNRCARIVLLSHSKARLVSFPTKWNCVAQTEHWHFQMYDVVIFAAVAVSTLTFW